MDYISALGSKAQLYNRVRQLRNDGMFLRGDIRAISSMTKPQLAALIHRAGAKREQTRAALDVFRQRLHKRGVLSRLVVKDLTNENGTVLARKGIEVDSLAGLTKLARKMWHEDKHRRIWLSFNDHEISGRFLGQTGGIDLDTDTPDQAAKNLLTAVSKLIGQLNDKKESYEQTLYGLDEDDDFLFMNRLLASEITMIQAKSRGGCNKTKATLET